MSKPLYALPVRRVRRFQQPGSVGTSWNNIRWHAKTAAICRIQEDSFFVEAAANLSREAFQLPLNRRLSGNGQGVLSPKLC